jgi:hypothetical protein
MRKLCSATGKTIFISPTVAKQSRDKHYYDVLRRKIDGRRYKHRRGRAYRCRVYECEYCGGFHLTHMAYWVLNSKKYVEKMSFKKLKWTGLVQIA